MAEKVRIGIVGCGGIANGKHFPSLSKLSNVELVAFCDIVPERAELGMAKYGAKDAKTYTDYRKLLEDKTIDVVHVLTPNDAHAEVSIAAMEAGKHCMSEKPMAKTAEGARRMVEAAKRTGKKLTIGYNNRFRPDSQYLHNICEAGNLGEIYFAKPTPFDGARFPPGACFWTKRNRAAGR